MSKIDDLLLEIEIQHPPQWLGFGYHIQLIDKHSHSFPSRRLPAPRKCLNCKHFRYISCETEITNRLEFEYHIQLIDKHSHSPMTWFQLVPSLEKAFINSQVDDIFSSPTQISEGSHVEVDSSHASPFATIKLMLWLDVTARMSSREHNRDIVQSISCIN